MTIALLKRDLAVFKDPHVSPSQVGKKRGCWREWGYSKVRPRKPSGPAAKFGTETHTVLEDYLRHGIIPDAATKQGRVAMSGLHFLPQPGQAVVEHEARPVLFGVPWIMRIDFLFGYMPGECIVVGDHKTTGDWKHMKTHVQLAEDPQRIAYAYWAVTELKLRGVYILWVYYNRNTEEARTVCFYEDAPTIIARFEALHAYDVEPMIAQGLLRQSMGDDEAWIDQLPRDDTLENCGAYGGCDFKAECHALISPMELATRALARTT